MVTQGRGGTMKHEERADDSVFYHIVERHTFHTFISNVIGIKTIISVECF